MCIYIVVERDRQREREIWHCIYCRAPSHARSRVNPPPHPLSFTRYCYYHYCIVYGRHTGGWRGRRILPNGRAIVLHQSGQCRWEGARKGWFARAQKLWSKQISCTKVSLYKIFVYFEAFEHEPIILLLPPATCNAHTIAVLLHDCCAIRDPLPDPSCVVPYTIQYWQWKYLVKPKSSPRWNARPYPRRCRRYIT